MKIYCYEAEDNNGRPIMVAYLDGKPKDPTKEIDIVSYNSFIEKQEGLVKEYMKVRKYKEAK